ncbi:putative ethylene-responsive transcription factor-like [Capsicum annuum]|nr:putative ethylene-responsive transcription factor-like [Capsicum annuum]
MQAIHGRNDRQLIVLNELNQPIGPTKAVVTEFSSFLGTLARNGTFCPLNLSWTKLKTHDDMWSYIQVLSSQYFDFYLAKRPISVPEPIFEDLLKHWHFEEAKVEMERVDTQESKDSTQSTNSFTTVMGIDYPGRVRLLKHGVTMSLLKKKASNSGSSSKPDELVEKRLDELKERLTLDPNMLGFNVHSSGEALANQPINYQSVGSNNQGYLQIVLSIDVAPDDKCIGIQYVKAIKAIQNFDPDFVPLRNVHIVDVPDEEVGRFDVIKAVGTAGHGSKLYDNTITENLMKSIEVITKFRESKIDIVKVGLATNSEVILVNLVFLKAGTPSLSLSFGSLF